MFRQITGRPHNNLIGGSSVEVQASSPSVRVADSRLTTWVVVILMLGLSTFLLFYQLDAKSLWIDEFDTVSIARESSFERFLASYLASERQPPLHHLFLYATGLLTGQTSDLVMRLPSAFAGLATVLSLFFLGRKLGGARLGLLAAWLLALSPTFVLYARMARYYAFSVLFSTLSCLLFLKLLEATEQGRSRSTRGILTSAYLIFTLLMLFSAYPTAAIFLLQSLFSLYHVFLRRLRLRYWIITHSSVAIFFGAWLVWILPVLGRYRGEESPFSIQGLKKVALTTVYPFYSFAVGETIFPWHPLAIIGLVATAILIVSSLRNVGLYEVRLHLYLFVGSLAGTVMIFLLVLADIPFVTAASRSIFSLPFFSLLLASGLLCLKRRWLRAVVGISLMAAYAFSLSNYFSNLQFHNPVYVVPTKEIVSTLFAQAQPGDIVISDRDTGVEFYWPTGSEQPVHYRSNNSDQLVDVLASGSKPRVWLVTLGRDRTKGAENEDLENWLNGNYSQEKEWGYAPQDPVFREVKRKILGYEDYLYKALVQLYTSQ